MPKYTVVRQHLGDRLYLPGETRELPEAEARHLIPRCLEPIATKAEPTPKNKAEGPPPNKADDAPEALRTDGPTVEEYVAAGYRATSYPPRGYASRSTAEDIAAAVAAQPAPKKKARDYPDLTVAELKALAEERALDLGDARLKADIIAALELSDEHGADDPEAGE